jgi:hypothetical protein
MKKFSGRNVFGQRCIAKFVKLEKETAVEQYLAILADIENANGKKSNILSMAPASLKRRPTSSTIRLPA